MAGAAPQISLTMPWAEPQLWLTDHEKKGRGQLLRQLSSSQVCNRPAAGGKGSIPMTPAPLGISSPSILGGCCPLDNGELSPRGRNSHRPQKRDPVLEMRFFRVLLYYTSVICRLRTTQMHSCFPNKVFCIQFDFFPLHNHNKALEMVQIKLVNISPSLCICFWPQANGCILSIQSTRHTFLLKKCKKRHSYFKKPRLCVTWTYTLSM